MDKNALTEQRRETVIGLLKSMNIKQGADGGFDKDDVYECMQQLCDLYEKNIEELENAYGLELTELKEKYQKYDENNDLYVSLIMEAKKSSNDIINQAKEEVESILAEGREKVAQQEQELEQMRNGMEIERTTMIEELEAAKKAVDAEKAALRADLEAEKQKLLALKDNYNQQLSAMEEEFAEIKTNILRTAGKMDSLKNKIPEVDDVNWNVASSAEAAVAAVDFPVEEIQVEETVATDSYMPNLEPAEPMTPTPAPIPEAPVSEMPIPEAPVEMPVSEPVPEVTEPVAEINLEDLMAETEPAPMAEAAQATQQPEQPTADTMPGIDFDKIEIDLPELQEAAPVADTAAPEEISFEGLEELFQDEEK